MVRTYIRKTQRGAGLNYSQEDLEHALEDIRNGNKTTRGAAAFYNIPRSTLKHRVLGTRGKGNTTKDGKGGGGVISFLSAAEEEEIANCIRVMDKNGFGLSRHEVLDMVQIYIRQNNIECRFKDQRPGEDWFLLFKKRHRLSVKRAQSIEHIRCDQTNPWVVYNFFEVLSNTITELNLSGKPDQVYNCDETSFCHDPSKTKIVGAIGEKSMRKTSSSGRENTSVLLCCSAEGRMLPLLCVFKGKFVMENWINEETVTQTAISVTSRGWMETTLFYNWFRDVFLPNIGEERPVLLIYDGHTTHISTSLIRLAQENQVTILKLPPHTTHILQPLDVAVFKSLKTNWDKEICKWQRANPRKKIPKHEFVSLITKLAQNVPAQNIVNGFKTTGIYDSEKKGVNKDAIPETVFKATDLQRYKSDIRHLNATTVPMEVAATSTDSVTQVVASASTASTMPELATTSTASDLPRLAANSTALIPPELATNSTTSSPLEVTTTSTAPVLPELAAISTFSIPLEVATTSTASALPQLAATLTASSLLEVATTSTASTLPESSSIPLEVANKSTGIPRKSFEELLLEMLKKEKKPEVAEKKRKRLVTNCEIITTGEYLLMKEKEEKEKEESVVRKRQNKEERFRNKELKLEKRKINTKKNYIKKKNHDIDDETSEESDHFSVQDSDEDNFLSDSGEEEEKEKEMLLEGEYCIVKVYGKTPTNFRLYVARVNQWTNSGYDVTFMKRHPKTMKFVETAESSFVPKNDIVQKLPQPIKNSSARYKDMISFNVDFSDLTNIY